MATGGVSSQGDVLTVVMKASVTIHRPDCRSCDNKGVDNKRGDTGNKGSDNKGGLPSENIWSNHKMLFHSNAIMPEMG